MLLICLLISTALLVNCEDVTVTLPNGQIRGSVHTTYRNALKFYYFIGIPFAAPPVGNLRFMPPQPVKNWEGVLETKSKKNVCYQVQKDSENETEDCLYLSVYTPVEPGTDAKLPVIVNTYGGTYIHGSFWANYIKPQNVLEQNIVVVDYNYRLGPFGFLSTGDTVIAGNMGLKDQRMVLQWIQNNIHLFGGDPTKVTLMGQSAGAASVTYHILSQSSAGLFRAAVAESASALCGWAYQTTPVDIAYGIAAEIDASFTSNRSSQELLTFLQSVDASAIDATGDKYYKFAPVIEVEQEGAMITKSMYESVESGQINKIPLLIGFNSEEEIAKASNPTSLLSSMKTFDNHLDLLIPGGMHITDSKEMKAVGEQIRKIYTDGLFQESVTASVKYFSDNQYIRPVIKFAELQSQFTDVYVYEFSYHGTMGFNMSMDGVYGVAHGEDVKYFWTYYADLSELPKPDINTMDRYVTLLTNFAKHLNPTPDANSQMLQNIVWPKFDKTNQYYLNLDKDLQVEQNPREFSYQKWGDIFTTYGKKPYITY